jgi:hypothetical protein
MALLHNSFNEHPRGENTQSLNAELPAAREDFMLRA